jgi:hypothetical protein
MRLTDPPVVLTGERRDDMNYEAAFTFVALASVQRAKRAILASAETNVQSEPGGALAGSIDGSIRKGGGSTSRVQIHEATEGIVMSAG